MEQGSVTGPPLLHILQCLAQYEFSKCLLYLQLLQLMGSGEVRVGTSLGYLFGKTIRKLGSIPGMLCFSLEQPRLRLLFSPVD